MSFLDQCIAFTSFPRSSAAAMSRLHDRSSSSSSGGNGNSLSGVLFSEDARFIRLSVDLPGVLNRDLSVELQRGVLVIRGKRETELAGGVRHQHRFCRRFAMDTDVVDSSKLKANLNRQGVLIVMAPKKSLPTNISISVTEEDDRAFERSVLESYVPQVQGEAAALTHDPATSGDTVRVAEEQDTEKIEVERETKDMGNCPPVVEDEEQTKKKAGATFKRTTMQTAQLPDSTSIQPSVVVSIESNKKEGEQKRKTCRPVHHSSFQSHLMIRRSQGKRPNP